jgi:hypothetical protein
MRHSHLWPSLLLAIIYGLSHVLQGQSEAPQAEMGSTDPVVTIKQAIERQDTYLDLQKRRVCRYTRTVRSQYQSGESQSRTVHSDEVSFDIGRDDPQQADAGVIAPGTSSKTFDLWNHPLFQAILQHSLFARSGSSLSWNDQTVDVYQFSLDPAFQPSTYLERVAQGVQGKVSIDQKTGLFVGLHAVAVKDVYDGKRLLLLGPRRDAPIPVFFYAAEPYDGIVVPTTWDEATFAPVRRGGYEINAWLGTLTRTSIHFESCREYKVKSTIQPGFKVVDPEKAPQ